MAVERYECEACVGTGKRPIAQYYDGSFVFPKGEFIECGVCGGEGIF